jgi:hypothetical protein
MLSAVIVRLDRMYSTKIGLICEPKMLMLNRDEGWYNICEKSSPFFVEMSTMQECFEAKNSDDI